MLWGRGARAERPAANVIGRVRKHGERSASGSIVRPLPSFEHPAGSHLRLLGEVAGARYAEPYGKRTGQSPLPPRRRDSQLSPYLTTTGCISQRVVAAYPPQTMASLNRSSLLPQCTSCIRRITWQNLDVGGPQQTRGISKKAKEAERNIVVQLLKDVPRYGRAGACVVSPGLQALLILSRLLCAIESFSHAQSVVPSPGRQLRARTRT
jgi:hypothetical protein